MVGVGKGTCCLVWMVGVRSRCIGFTKEGSGFTSGLFIFSILVFRKISFE